MADTSKTAEEVLNNWLYQTTHISLNVLDNTRSGKLQFPVYEDPYLEGKRRMEDQASKILGSRKSKRSKTDKYLSEIEPFRTIHEPKTRINLNKILTKAEPTPKYKVLDFDDNILGETFTIDEALKMFKNRYEFFTKESALPFIYKL